MASLRRRSSTRQSWAWLLWFALFLPLAQTAATWHVYSHVEEEAGDRAHGKQAPSLAHCDLCLTATALSGGALVGKNDILPVVAAHEVVPQDPVASAWLALPTLAYQSRAPPNSAS
jgi:hypothetical protein